MMFGVNKAYFGGQQVVTCYSCHRGGDHPKATVSLGARYGAPPGEEEECRADRGSSECCDRSGEVCQAQKLGTVHSIPDFVAPGLWLLIENIRAGDFHAQIGNLKRLRFKKTGLACIHAPRMRVYQPHVRHAPGFILLELVANFGEPVIQRKNFDSDRRRGLRYSHRLLGPEDRQVWDHVSSAADSHPRFGARKNGKPLSQSSEKRSQE